MNFSDFLARIRSDNELTQQALVELLIDSDPSLAKLDLTTLSRWERGVTKPKLEKQFLIARIMGYDVAELIDPNTNTASPVKSNLEKVMSRVANPYLTQDVPFKLVQLDSLKNEPLLCKKLQAFHQDYLGLKVECAFFEKDNLHADIYINELDELVGHLIYGYLPVDTDYSALDVEHLDECKFINPKIGSRVILYIVSIFSSLPKPRTVNILSMLDLLRKNYAIQSAVINCHFQEAFNLYDATQTLQVLRKGEQVEHGGIKLFNKNYRYVQISVSPEAILASKAIADLIPYTCDFIKDMMNENNA